MKGKRNVGKEENEIIRYNTYLKFYVFESFSDLENIQ